MNDIEKNLILLIVVVCLIGILWSIFWLSAACTPKENGRLDLVDPVTCCEVPFTQES